MTESGGPQARFERAEPEAEDVAGIVAEAGSGSSGAHPADYSVDRPHSE